jgi:predicted transcriptional regulator
MADFHDTPEQDEPARLNAETSAAREARLRWEAESIARGEAQAAAGLLIEEEDLDAWLDQLEIDPDAPMPLPRVSQPQP